MIGPFSSIAGKTVLLHRGEALPPFPRSRTDFPPFSPPRHGRGTSAVCLSGVPLSPPGASARFYDDAYFSLSDHMREGSLDDEMIFFAARSTIVLPLPRSKFVSFFLSAWRRLRTAFGKEESLPPIPLFFPAPGSTMAAFLPSNPNSFALEGRLCALFFFRFLG